MKRRLLALLTVMGFCGLVGMLVFKLESRKPVYQGKSVKTWLLQLSAPDPKARDEAEAVFQALGTNVVPELARLLHLHDARWRELIWSRATRIPRLARGPVLGRVSPPNAYLIRPAAARALGKLGPAAVAAEPDLVRALQDKVNGTYWEAGAALGRIGKQSVPDLIHALQDRDVLVRSAAAYGLREVGPGAAPAVPQIIQMLMHGSLNEQQIASQSLTKIGLPAVAPLIEAFMHEGGNGREAAAGALLGYYGRPGTSRPPGKDLPADETATTRQRAVEMLGESGLADERVVKLLAGAVKDPAPGVRLAALKALARVKQNPQPAMPGLIACLRDESPAIRERSARALGRIGPFAKPAMRGLARLAEDKEDAVRAAAQEALEAIKPSATNDWPILPK
ncbi:MAG: HEAT repeat domain-containing protein [Verrucomicrobia bacterium]|nr:HEAT repeat domain-containing protein [Verrucomicrobiota bacterium]